MQIRLQGSRIECGTVITAIRKAIPDSDIEKISEWAPNRRPGEDKNTGRVYIYLKAKA